MKKQMTLVYYYVPEDKDDPQVPNVFGINIKKDQIRLKNIYENFPITGQYIFRFKVLYENNIAWLDLPDPNAKLPTFKQKIMIKASRVSWQNKKKNFQTKSPSVSNIKTATNNNINSNNTSLLNDSPKTKSKKQIPSSPSIIQQNLLAKKPSISDSFNLIDQVHNSHHSKNSQNNDDLI